MYSLDKEYITDSQGCMAIEAYLMADKTGLVELSFQLRPVSWSRTDRSHEY